MATDLHHILANLLAFYDFSDKTVIVVGAGNGQLVLYARAARRVIAVDKDATAIERLAERVSQLGLGDRCEPLLGDFMTVGGKADVVLFEFSLHEMASPAEALDHARHLADDVVVIDHSRSSAWAFFTDEVEKVAASWNAVRAAGLRRAEHHQAVQSFGDHEELLAKVHVQGVEAVRRAERLRGQDEITIPMGYTVALV